MSVVANIAINVDSTKAVNDLKAVDNAAAGVNAGTSKLKSAFGGLQTAIAALGIGALVKDLAGVGIDADRTDKRIRNLADANGETAKVFDIAAKAAKSFGLSNLEAEKGVADLYGRLRPTGVALNDIETVFNGVNKAALAAGLGAADTEGVFLQLSQALGSGALQGDELRSIMERMPAVGQAVAKVMGVTVGEIKKLGADGKITTDVMIKAAAELNKLTPPPPDPFKVFNAEMANLREELGENLLPILTPFVGALIGVLKAFSAMPEPLQTVIVGLAAATAAILAIGVAMATLAPVFTALGTAFSALAALNVGGLIAGWLPVVVSASSGIVAALGGILTWVGGTLIPGLLAFFSGPVGWTILAVAAVVAMAIAFREPIAKFFSWLGDELRKAVKPFQDWGDRVLKTMQNAIKDVERVWNGFDKYIDANVIKPVAKLWNDLTASIPKAMATAVKNIQDTWSGIARFFTQNVTKPIGDSWNAVAQLLPSTMQKSADFVKSTWVAVIESIKGVVRGLLQFVVSGINSVVGAINGLINKFNQVSAASGSSFRVGTLGILSVPAFAEGGIVTKPTLAMVGEGGEPEYIIPESKMAATASNYLAGQRGASAMQTHSSIPSINIQTGPVVEFNGERYVTMADFERGLQQVASNVFKGLRTPAGRYAMGVR
jgi:tape measure domain-containing protein